MQPFDLGLAKVGSRRKAATLRGWLALVLALALVSSTIPQWESVTASTLEEVTAFQGHGDELCDPEKNGRHQHLGCSISGTCSAWAPAPDPYVLDFSTELTRAPDTEILYSGSIPRPRFHPPKLTATI